ncbi:MAG: hypothetical protein LZ172_06055 [Thaumarchaeota archaeon]|nr:hypothetical protein [Candidatus Geocrenenecus arthurdayi]MCL7403889.1 hypothetical protein [Candidatus Geocrenenecus arthurdayi]
MKKLNIKIFSESYANKWFSEKLRETLSSSFKIVIDHTPRYGRDRVIKELQNQASNPNLDSIIAVIDYERGQRSYVERFFTENIDKFENINIRYAKFKGKNYIGIIFDPNFEEAILCKINKNYHLNYRTLTIIKSPSAQEFLDRFTDDERIRGYLMFTKEKLVSLL